MRKPYDYVLLGLSLSSSWGNGHASTYRSLIKGLAARGRRVLFLEREQPWYARARDLRALPGCDLQLYPSLDVLRARHAQAIRHAGAVIVGSFVPDGVEVCRWVLHEARGVRAFYDIDTPVTCSALARGQCDYLERDQIPEFDLLLSFTGGPMLARLQTVFGARCARALYCSVDPLEYQPAASTPAVSLGYMGTYSADRQGKLEELLLNPARACHSRSFVVAGAQYPADVRWPPNVTHLEHVPPAQHRRFYGDQRFTLNLTRAQMVQAGYSPSIRLFEAAACATPVMTDAWAGLVEFFTPGEEILPVDGAGEVIACLERIPEERRRRIGLAARERVRREHSSLQRAAQLDHYIAARRASREVLSINRKVGA